MSFYRDMMRKPGDRYSDQKIDLSSDELRAAAGRALRRHHAARDARHSPHPGHMRQNTRRIMAS